MNATANRYDIYGPIHRGLRLGLVEAMVALGRADAGADTLTQVLDRVEEQLDLNVAHLKNEDRVIHPQLLTRAGVVHRALEAAHDLHRHSIARLKERVRTLRTSVGEKREAELRALYLDLTVFIAEDLLHMANEERIVLPALQAILTDDELGGMEREIIEGIDDDELYRDLLLMLRSANSSGRNALLAAIEDAVRPSVRERIRSQVSNDNTIVACEGHSL